MARRADLAVRLRLIGHALRWRSGSSVMLFFVAVVAIAGAAIGPIFLSASDNSVLASTLSSAQPGQGDLLFLTNGPQSITRQMDDAAATARSVAGRRLLGPPIYTTVLGTGFIHAKLVFEQDLLWRSDVCGHLQFVKGSCPTSLDEVAMSARSAATAGFRVGSRVRLLLTNSPKQTYVKVVGIYLQPPSVNNAYWGGVNYFGYGFAPSGVITLDPMICTEQTDFAAAAPSDQVQLAADMAWKPASFIVGKARLENALSGVDHALFSRYGLTVASGLPALIATAQHGENLMSAVVLAIVLQLVLLALLVLYGLGRSTAGARRLEADFARRRGFPRGALLSLAVTEPAALITLGLPFGVLVAWVVVKVFAADSLFRGIPVDVTSVAVLAALGGYAAALAATTFASYALWRRAGEGRTRRLGPAAVMLDTFGVALGLAGLLALATKGALNGTHADPLAAAAPGLLALGAAVIGLRLMGGIVSVLVRSSRESSHVAWFLALRQIARRPDVLRRLFPLAAATAVVLFAVGSFALAAENRGRVAQFETGANEVVDVTPPTGVDFVAAVRRADPSGHDAMAVAFDEAQNGELLAVDSTRFPSVASWPSGLSATPVRTLIAPLAVRLHPGVTLLGNNLRTTLSIPPGTPSMIGQLTLYNVVYQSSFVANIGPTEAGTHTYVTSLQDGCLVECRLLNLSLAWDNANNTDPTPVSLRLDSMSIDAPSNWHVLPIGATTPDSWEAASAGVRVVSDQGGRPGVAIHIGSSFLVGGVEIEPNYLPAAMPSLPTGQLEAVNPPSRNANFPYEGLDGGPVTLRAIGEVPAIPEVGPDGALVDLSLAERAQSQPAIYTTYQVWLTGTDDRAILARLRKEGFQVGSASFASTRLAVLNHAGLALAYDLALIVTPIAALLAVGAVVFAIAAEGRRRRHQIASLATVGLPRREIRRALFAENALVLFAALIVGGAIGIAADALALSSLPQFSGGTGGLPITNGVPIGWLFAALGVLAVALVLAASFSSRLVIRQAFSGETIEQR